MNLYFHSRYFTNVGLGNQDWDEMEAACEYYEKALGFHRFWSGKYGTSSLNKRILTLCS